MTFPERAQRVIHAPMSTVSVRGSSRGKYRFGTDIFEAAPYSSRMVTRKSGKRGQRRNGEAPRLAPSPLSIGARMEKLGITDQQLADHVGVERESVNRWRNHERFPRREHLERIAEKLKCTVPELLADPHMRPSLDQMVAEVPDADRERAYRAAAAVIGQFRDEV